MGDEGDDAVPTGVAPTELGQAVSETEAHTAWSLDDGWEEPQRRPGWIVAVAVASSVALVIIAAVVGFVYLRGHEEPASSGAAARMDTSIATTSTTSAQAVPPPPTSSQPPAPVTLRPDGYGSAHVRTLSGKTVCALTAGDVECNVHFTNGLGPDYNGMPASGVGINSRGAFQWLYGDPGDPDYVTMAYGTLYSVLGWTITPTSEGTTFMYDATGHGMTVSVDGFSTF